jgi:imidazolonepropionase-like amidohydrolase
MKKYLFFLITMGIFSSLLAQDYFPKNEQLKENYDGLIAFTNAVIHIDADREIDSGTLLIRSGKIISVGSNVKIPDHALVHDLAGKHIYPSFVDAYTNFGVATPKSQEGGRRSPQYEPTREGFYWNDHIRAEQKAVDHFKYDEKTAQSMREQGFGVVHSLLKDGISRGSGLIVALSDESSDADRLLETNASQCFSFEKSSQSSQSYPGSLMGAMALLRQMYHDANWYRNNGAQTDQTLEALLANQKKPAFFEAGDNANTLRAHSIGAQFNQPYILVGASDGYEYLNELAQTKAHFVLPINFPQAYDVTDPYYSAQLSLEDLRRWNQAPLNPKKFAEQNIKFSLSTHDLKSPKSFSEHLSKAIEYGLDPKEALRALTTIPAAQLGVSSMLGSLEAGKLANFLISDTPLFSENSQMQSHWILGKPYNIKLQQHKTSDEYQIAIAGRAARFVVENKDGNLSLKYGEGDSLETGKITQDGQWLKWQVKDKDQSGVLRAMAQINPDNLELSGQIFFQDGESRSFVASPTAFTPGINPDADKDSPGDSKEMSSEGSGPEVMPITYPNMGFGRTQLPAQQTVLFKNATVWTGEKEGILSNTDVLVKNGKIQAIGTGLSDKGARVIDATGKHLTAGIIDEHTHIAALTINEGGQNSSAEVCISDVVNPKDISIYRNLAGGVTSAQILHGSANPIGGQSAIIKLKWGASAQDMLYDNAPKFIKFALGENVKQSNWSSFSRYPQTRMGVEQLYINYFNRARTYLDNKKSGAPYRVDEELEILGEILEGERFISCHSYVQSEINMLMKVAESFDFRVNTFTHILEGYKVAEKMAQHGVGGSTFSDWWAYKYEVKDAIPFNAAIMARAGVTTAINSDDDEMARRLNQEAAKTVKYGGMDEEKAWAMVTINPAKLLHLDDRTGSIKKGKDADLVLWNEHPLSVYAHAEKTMIDGAFYFDIDEDQALRQSLQKEKNQLIQMMLSDQKSSGSKGRAPGKRDRIKFDCETIN